MVCGPQSPLRTRRSGEANGTGSMSRARECWQAASTSSNFNDRDAPFPFRCRFCLPDFFDCCLCWNLKWLLGKFREFKTRVHLLLPPSPIAANAFYLSFGQLLHFFSPPASEKESGLLPNNDEDEAKGSGGGGIEIEKGAF